MQISKILAVVLFKAVLATNEGQATIITDYAWIPVLHSPEPQVHQQLPQAAATNLAPTMTYPQSAGPLQAAITAQHAALKDVPIVTPVQRYLEQNPQYQYLPKPPPMPTTVPKYPQDMEAQLNSAIIAEIAGVKGGSHPGPKDTASALSLQSEISSRWKEQKSAEASISSLQNALSTQIANFVSASKALAAAQNTFTMTAHGDGSMLLPNADIGWLTSLIAFGFAGLAFAL